MNIRHFLPVLVAIALASCSKSDNITPTITTNNGGWKTLKGCLDTLHFHAGVRYRYSAYNGTPYTSQPFRTGVTKIDLSDTTILDSNALFNHKFRFSMWIDSGNNRTYMSEIVFKDTVRVSMFESYYPFSGPYWLDFVQPYNADTTYLRASTYNSTWSVLIYR